MILYVDDLSQAASYFQIAFGPTTIAWIWTVDAGRPSATNSARDYLGDIEASRWLYGRDNIALATRFGCLANRT